MNEDLIIKSLKIKTYLLNSYYSFRNPNFISEYFSKDKKNDEISTEIYNDLHEGVLGVRLDYFKELLDLTWRGNFDGRLDINKAIYKSMYDLAEEFFYLKNGEIHIKNSDNKKNNSFSSLEIGRDYNNKFKWNMVKHLLDSDILVATYLLVNEFDSKRDMALWDAPIFTSDTSLEKILDKGVAELHMHIGASKRFDTIWTYLMNNKINHLIKKQNLLYKLKLNTYEGVISYGNFINSSKNIRLLMALFLKSTQYENLNKFIDEKLESFKELKFIINQLISGKRLDKVILEFDEIFDKLRESFNLNYEDLDLAIDNSNTKRYLNNVILGEDILTYIFDDFYSYNKEYESIDLNYNHDNIIFPENIFVFKALKYLNDNNFKDELFAECFWQYIRIKNIFFKYIVQQKISGKGLDIFSDIYKRQSPLGGIKFLEEAFYTEVKNQNIKKFEIRCGFKDNHEELRLFLINLFKSYRNILKNNYFINVQYKALPLLGIIFHFNKNTYPLKKETCFFEYKHTNNCKFLYQGDKEELYLNQSKILSDIRRSIPKLDYYIVGVDAASKELEANPFVFKKAYKYLRSNKSMKSNSNIRTAFVRNIGFTYHIGEEFRDIISGLRHIDELIEEFEFESGDRLGHCIVLGIDIDKWSETNSVVYMKAEDYLDNLLWEWRLYTNTRDFKDIENIHYLENRIFEVIEYIFGFSEGISIRDLYRAYKRKISRDNNCNIYVEENIKSSLDKCKISRHTKEKFKISVKNNIDYLDKDYDFRDEDCEIVKQLQNVEIEWKPYLVYKALNCKYFLKELDKPVKINIDKETIEKSKKIQNYMKKKISDRQIVLELNPTSNIYIGEFKSFKDYHILNLSSPKKENVIITINTDDPVIFNTKINNEYSLIYDIMMSTGEYESKEIIDWLDKIRLNGLEYSFIKDRKLTANELELEIKEIIKDLENLDISKLI
ncbi:adenosine deaminase [Clostridium perfringens]|uniref:adenosine deaminase n=1 Tax=Clostridium perfringens TaxID=1502 RepID=UPI00224526EA|nr:adenosine deaminase [Clostridium perfringens]MCX0380734.1 adenosine deaminase [Clostridium perfringens]